MPMALLRPPARRARGSCGAIARRRLPPRDGGSDHLRSNRRVYTMEGMTTERFEVERLIEADPAAIFAVLRDPQGHVAIDSSGMLMSADGELAGAVGDRFVVHMDREALNDYPLGKYDVTVR